MPLFFAADGCVCARAGLRARSRLLLAGNGRKSNPASAQQVPGLLLITRQRCKELDKDKSGTALLILMSSPLGC